jgi:hypothetical protein
MDSTIATKITSVIARAGKDEADVKFIALKDAMCDFADFCKTMSAEPWDDEHRCEDYHTSYRLSGLVIVGKGWSLEFEYSYDNDTDYCDSYYTSKWTFRPYMFDVSRFYKVTCSEMFNVEEISAPAELIEYNSISPPGCEYLMLGRMFAHVFGKEATKEQLDRLGPYVAKLMKPSDKVTVYHRGKQMRVNYYPPACYGKLKKVIGDFIA